MSYMKRHLELLPRPAALAILVLPSLILSLHAASVTYDCTTFHPNPTSGISDSGSCPGFSIPGATIAAITISETTTVVGDPKLWDGVIIEFDPGTPYQPSGNSFITWTYASGAKLTADGYGGGSSSDSWSASNFANIDFSQPGGVPLDVGIYDPSIYNEGVITGVTVTSQIQYTYDTPTTAPEPATTGLLGISLALIGYLRKRKSTTCNKA